MHFRCLVFWRGPKTHKESDPNSRSVTNIQVKGGRMVMYVWVSLWFTNSHNWNIYYVILIESGELYFMYLLLKNHLLFFTIKNSRFNKNELFLKSNTAPSMFEIMQQQLWFSLLSCHSNAADGSQQRWELGVSASPTKKRREVDWMIDM